MARGVLAITLVLLALTVGCCSNPHCHGGKLVAELGPKDTPSVETAPYKANYALYRWRKPPEGAPPATWIADHEVEQVYLRGLSGSDKVGFERDSKGQLFAVAGEEKIPLADGRYCWHITAETEYRGLERVLHETNETLVGLAWMPVTVPLFVIGAVTVGFMAMGCGLVAICCV